MGPGRFLGILGDRGNLGWFALRSVEPDHLLGSFERIALGEDASVPWQASVSIRRLAAEEWYLEFRGHPDYGGAGCRLKRFATPQGDALLGAFSYDEDGMTWSATVGIWLDSSLDSSRFHMRPDVLPRARIRSGGRFRLWSAGPAGLANNATRSLLKASDGHLWVGTTDGISRFDGQQWVTYNAETAPSLPGWNCRGLTEDREGRLIVMLKHHGFFRLRDHGWEPLACNPQLFGTVPSGLNQDDEGNLWFSADSIRLCRIDPSESLTQWEGDSLMPLRRPDASVLPRIGGGVPYLDGTVFGTARGMRFFRPDVSNEPFWILPQVGDLARIVPGNSGDLWVTSLSIVLRYDRSGNVIERYSPRAKTGSLRHAFPSSKGGIWLIGVNGLFHMPNPREIVHYPTVPTSMTDGVTEAFEDDEGNVWIATSGRGLCSFRPDGIETVETPTGDNAIFLNRTRPIGLATDSEGELLLAFGAVAARRQGGAWKVPETSGWFEHKVVAPGYRPHSDDWWAAGVPYPDNRELVRQGSMPSPIPIAVRFSAGEPRYVYHPDFPLGLEGVRSIAAVRESGMWLGTSEGILVCRDDGFVLDGAEMGVPRGQISALHSDRDGSVWVGTPASGLYRIFPSSSELQYFSVANKRLPSDRIHCLAASEVPGVWLAGGDGVFWLDPTFPGPAKSMTGNLKAPVHALVEDRLGNLWAGTSTGIYALPSAGDLRQVKGSAGEPQWLRFGRSDGLANVSTESGHSPVAVETADGYVNVCMQGELVRFDPEALLSQVTDGPVVLIQSIEDGERTYWSENTAGSDRLSSEVIELPPGSGERLKISFRAIHFSEPDLVEFR